MTISPSKARRLAKRILRENKIKSYRVIAREDFDSMIKPGTLNRFAKSKGEWYPVDKNLQIILGLRKARKPRPKQKTMTQMNNRELLELCNTRINKLNEVIHARGLKVSIGWIKEK